MVLEGRLTSINSRRRSRSELIFASARQQHALVVIIQSREQIISILTWYRKENRHCCNVFEIIILQRTSLEVNVFHLDLHVW